MFGNGEEKTRQKSQEWHATNGPGSAGPGQQRHPPWKAGALKRDDRYGLRRGPRAVPRKSHRSKPNPKVPVWEAGPLEGDAVMRVEPHDGISVLTEETPELPRPSHHGRTQREDTFYEPGGRFSPDTASAGAVTSACQPPER